MSDPADDSYMTLFASQLYTLLLFQLFFILYVQSNLILNGCWMDPHYYMIYVICLVNTESENGGTTILMSLC